MIPPSWAEVQLAVGGALRLACGDRGGLAFFDTTIGGFWRSFCAATICFPFYLLLLGFHITTAQWNQYGGVSIVTVEAIKYVIAWVAFPLIILPISDLFDRGNRFLAFMVVYNWSQIPQFALFMVIGLDGATGLLPPSILQPVQFAALIAVLVYEWYIGRVALGVTGAQATLIVIVDQVLGTALDRIAQAIY
jgi:hypothetical protein